MWWCKLSCGIGWCFWNQCSLRQFWESTPERIIEISDHCSEFNKSMPVFAYNSGVTHHEYIQPVTKDDDDSANPEDTFLTFRHVFIKMRNGAQEINQRLQQSVLNCSQQLDSKLPPSGRFVPDNMNWENHRVESRIQRRQTWIYQHRANGFHWYDSYIRVHANKNKQCHHSESAPNNPANVYHLAE